VRIYQMLGATVAIGLVAFAGCQAVRRVHVEYREATPPPPPVTVVQPVPVYPAQPPVYAPVPPGTVAQAPAAYPVQPPAYTPASSAVVEVAQPAVEGEDVIVETRGPVHEAFAEPVEVNPEPTFAVVQAPPQAIEETPPAQRPAGIGVVWIPGYWSWDDDRGAHVWVSGTWRVPPPNCSWMPGYWSQTAAGWQWVPGFWMPQTTQEVVYLPAPPASQEAGPIGLAPSLDYTWVPGCWIWDGFRYQWRPGTWVVGQADWVWMPAHYIWTPRGYIYVEGHWDYALDRRGILFAPVYFQRGVYLNRGFAYSPAVVVDVGSLSIALFTRPSYSHYYFGDYYDAGYARRGIYPWCESRDRQQGYDPIYNHEEWQHRRDDPKWDQHVRQEFVARTRDQQARPPRTFVEQQKLARQNPQQATTKKLVTAQPLSEFTKSDRTAVKFEALTDTRRKQIEQKSKDLQQYRSSRAQWEVPEQTKPAVGPRPTPTPVVAPKPEIRKPEERVVTPPEIRKPVERVTPPVTRKPEERVVPPEVVKPEMRPVPTPDVRRPLVPETRKPEERVMPPEVVKPEMRLVPTPDVRRPLAPETRKPEERVMPPEVRKPEERVAPPEVRRPVEPTVVNPREDRRSDEPREPMRVRIPRSPLGAPDASDEPDAGGPPTKGRRG
jgi:hypothetical protein